MAKTKPITEFSETCDGPNSRFKWLGIARLSRIPDAGWPSRESCQKAVTAEERASGAKIVAEYRELIMPDYAKNLRLAAPRHF
jgi:hypothetical protein